MSKIARIYQGINEIQKIYQGGVLQRLFFDWKHYIGNELNIEYAKECVGRNVVISGKTYQNLCIEDTTNEITFLNVSNYSMFKTGTYYTIILEITVDNASQINLAFNSTSQIKVSPAGYNKGIYKFKVINTNTSLGEISSVQLLSLKQDGYTTCLFRNVIILEGDYTDTDLPTSIDGIESVAEREENLVNKENPYPLKLAINEEINPINLPIPLRSLPNGVADTIEGNKLVQRVGRVVLDGSSDENWSLRANAESSNFIYFHNSFSTMNKSFTDYTQSKNRMICDKLLASSNAGDNIAKEQCICGRSTGVGFCIALLKSNLETVDLTGFLKWLSENPVTVYYELAEPIETEITPDKIPLFVIKEGLTTLKSTNNITPQIELDCLVRDDFQNMCDNEWESGDIDLNTGVSKDHTDRIRLVNDIQVKSNTTYRIDIVNLMNITTYYANVGARYYDISKTYISGGLIGNIKSSIYTFTTPKDCYYIRLIAETKDVNFKIYLKEVIN